MAKLKLNKGKLAGVLAGLVLTGTIGGLTYQYLTSEDGDTKQENQIGHHDLIPLPFLSVDDEDFVVLDIGDHQDIGTYFQNQKMKFCNENDISLGVIVSTTATDEAAIYDDVEYVKGVLSQYQVDFPVYLDINRLMENKSLNTEMKTKIAKDFLEKCASNDIYVGVYGTDTNLNLCRFKKYCNISSYDAFLVMDQEKIQYDGTYYVVKDLEGNITASTDLAEVIQNNGNNTSNGFVQDGSYVVKANDDLIDIALQSGMSVDELLEFNEMKFSEVCEGVKLRIPSSVAPAMGTGEFVPVDTPLVGCDISYAQTDNIDWKQMKENFQFIIIKCSEGTTLDSYFNQNIKNCNTYGIPAGAYCYNGFHLDNTASLDNFISNQREQANFVLGALKNKKIDYPVYLDVEIPSGAKWEDLYNKEYVSVMFDIWVDTMEKAGYLPGLYCNQSGLDFLQSCVDYDLSERFELWVAGGDQYTGETQDIEFQDVYPSSILESRENVSMAQATDSAVHAGAGNGRGHLDINYSEVDYTQEITEYDGDTFPLKEFTRIPDKEILAGCGALFVGAVGVGVYHHVKSKKRR